MNKTVLVVGGGAAGLLAAGTAVREGAAVTLLERNDRPARKVMITGKGRCNVTNNCALSAFIENVPQNGRFLYSAAAAFTPQDMMALLEAQHVPLKTERGARVFPVSDRAVDVVDGLVRYAKGASFRKGRAVSLVMTDGICRGVRTEDGETILADATILCTGGLSYPSTGSTGDGYALAESAGHTIIPPRPSLIPLEIVEPWCGELSGLSLKNAALTVCDTGRNGRVIYDDFGELLFTHFGVSGPLILSASAHLREMEPARYILHIDLKPALSEAQLDDRLLRELAAHRNASVAAACATLLPRSLVPVMLRLCEIPAKTPCNAITKEARRALGARLKDLPLTVAGTRPIEEAVVTSGGVCVKEVDAKTMASGKAAGLYFAGELLDVDAYTGGFNLHIAFCTGHAAAKGAVKGAI